MVTTSRNACGVLLWLFAGLALIVSNPLLARGGGHSGGGHSYHSAGSHHSSARTHTNSSRSHSTRTERPHSSSPRASTSSHPRAAPGVARDSHGRIARSREARAQFMKSHPCPSTGRSSGACKGYVVDHRVALKRGGKDAPSNMQWQTVEAAKAKDRVE